MFERPSDFRVEYEQNRWTLIFKENGKEVRIQGYKSRDEVEKAIERLTHPEKIRRPVYSGECECINKQWIYYEEDKEHIVFQVCTVCNKPLDRAVVNHFNKDFDLMKFIAGEH